MSLEARALGLHVAGFDLLRNIDLQLVPGTVTAVVGPNGAGKTSLLRALVDEMPLSAGSVWFNGRPLRAWPLEERACLLAVLSQQSTLGFPFTAREVVALGRIPHRSGATRDAEIVRAALEQVDGSYLDRRLYTAMSGGERQRVQLARVLAQVWEPVAGGERVLMLDEPTAALDLSHQQLTLAIVRRVAADGVAVLIVLHDLSLAARCADRLVVLDGGRIAAQGAPAEVLDAELVQRVFGVQCIVTRHPLDGSPLVIH
jgi:iron complex transport system ATP-binding protein